MTVIDLDATAWRTRADFYAALLPRLGAPDWAGGNLDALFDVLSGHFDLKPPFEVVIRNTEAIPADELAYIRRASGVFADARATFEHDVALRFA